MTDINPELSFTLDDAVAEVLALLTGLDLTYDPDFDRYKAVVRAINRALRANALEHEWSFYSDVSDVGVLTEGLVGIDLPSELRPRITGDDACRLVNDDGEILRWAYFLPRDAIHKYATRSGLWVASRRNQLVFSRPITSGEAGLHFQVPVQREPFMFRLPEQPEDPNDPLVPVGDEVRNQILDFSYPDLVIAKAAYFYSLTDPIMQPRAQTLEANAKDLMYQVIERDDRSTDAPFQNDFIVPVGNDIYGIGGDYHPPYADERRY